MPRPALLRSAALIGALALLGSLAIPTAAQAAPGDDVLVFSNGSVVDTSPGVDGGEYQWISAAITAAGYTTIPFDGGDGQAATWTAALTGIDYFVLPDQESGDFYNTAAPPSWLSADAWDVLIDWIQAGGTFLVSGTCTGEQAGTGAILNAAVGVDYAGVLGSCYEPGSSTRWIDDSTLPATLDYANGTYAMKLTDFSPEQLAPLTVWYSSEGCGEELLTVGEFAAGSGRIAFEAWDYYNDTWTDQSTWNSMLASLLNGNAAASTWSALAPPPVPAAISTLTSSGQPLYTISEFGCDEEGVFFRVDPGTAQAVPVGTDSIEGYARQGAVNPATGIAYLPVLDWDSWTSVLYTVDLASGSFASVGGFTADVYVLYEVYSIAFAADGSAYAFAEFYDGDSDFTGLFSLDVSDASLTLIAAVDNTVLDEPDGFAFNPQDGRFYAFEEDSHEFFQVNMQTGALTSLGFLDAPSLEELSDVTALQIAADGTFWVVFDVEGVDENDVGMLAHFTLGDIVGGSVNAHEVGILTDDPLESYSLLLGAAILAETGLDAGFLAGGALSAGALLLLGTALVVVRSRRRTL